MLNDVDKIAGDVVHYNRIAMKTCTVLFKKFLNWFFFVKALRGITRLIHKLTSLPKEFLLCINVLLPSMICPAWDDVP